MNEPFEQTTTPEIPFQVDTALPALKAAYARGHYCDMGEKCPGCMAGNALEAITGRKWTQEECEECLTAREEGE